jgi:hypothetical protein
MHGGGDKSLTTVQQLVFLRESTIYRGVGQVTRGVLTWQWRRRPLALSRLYTLRLTYTEGESPEVIVLDPDLPLLADGQNLPHVYQDRPTRLCLYLPGEREWSPADRLDEKVLPWADEWLVFFESWLADPDRKWRGGGVHPGKEPQPAENRGMRRLQDAIRRQKWGSSYDRRR